MKNINQDRIDSHKLKFNNQNGEYLLKGIYLDEVDSTNEYCKRLINNRCYPNSEMEVVISDKQTAGKGRLGKTWSSNNSDGLWMSILVKPEEYISNIQHITIVTSLALINTLHKIIKLECKIKWPNDIIIHKKKLAGILCESFFYSNKDIYLIVGIGLNISQKEFDEEIKEKAVSLEMVCDIKFDKLFIAKEIFSEFKKLYNEFIKNGISDIIINWKSYLETINREVLFEINGYKRKGYVIDVSEGGELIIKTNTGIVMVNSGEVQVKGLLGYI